MAEKRISQLWPTKLSSLILVGLIILIPLSIYAEQHLPQAWGERLVIPRFERYVDRHTPRVVVGQTLPNEISSDIILDDINQPYLINDTVVILENASLTIQPGVQLVFSEFAHLSVYGSLGIQGTANKKVIFTTNEKHPVNQTWGGIIFQPGSVGDVSHATINHAVPGVSCLKDSTVVIRETEISLTSTGVYTASKRCFITASTLRSVDVGIAARGVQLQHTDTLIYAKRPEILFENN